MVKINVMEPLKERIALAKEERKFFEELWCYESKKLNEDVIPLDVAIRMNHLTKMMDRETGIIERLEKER